MISIVRHSSISNSKERTKGLDNTPKKGRIRRWVEISSLMDKAETSGLTENQQKRLDVLLALDKRENPVVRP